MNYHLRLDSLVPTSFGTPGSRFGKWDFQRRANESRKS
jgi:hypothetical protein